MDFCSFFLVRIAVPFIILFVFSTNILPSPPALYLTPSYQITTRPSNALLSDHLLELNKFNICCAVVLYSTNSSPLFEDEWSSAG